MAASTSAGSTATRWLGMVLLVLIGWPGQPVMAAQTGAWVAAPVAAAAEALAQCGLTVLSNRKNRLGQARMDCNGPPVVISADSRLLGQLGTSLQGVTLNRACSRPGCLLTICSYSYVRFVHSSIQGVHLPGVSAMLCVVEHAQVELHSANIADNAGRGLLVANNASVLLSGSTVAANVADAPGAGIAVLGSAKVFVQGGNMVTGNTAVNAGCGGLAGFDSSVIIVRGQSSIVQNVANGRLGGGGACVFDNASLTLQEACVVKGNKAPSGMGGGLLAADAASILVASQTKVVSNSAFRAGGISALNSSSLRILGASVVASNIAREAGGGVGAYNSSHVFISGQSTVAENTALKAGGGLVVSGGASLVLDGMSRVDGNTAAGSGGGLFATDNAKVLVTGGSVVAFNTATNFSGGGISLVSNATLEVMNGSSISHNFAPQSTGGGLDGIDSSHIVVSGRSLIANNTAEIGAGCYTGDTASLRIVGASVVANNTAKRKGCGGLLVEFNSTVVVSEQSRISGNNASRAGGGVCVLDDASFVLDGKSRVTGNMAFGGSGGGLIVTNRAKVLVTGGSVVGFNTATNFSGGGVVLFDHATVTITGGSSVVGNIVPNDPGGGVVGLDSSRIVVLGRSMIANNTAGKGSGGGLLAEGNSTIVVSEQSSITGNSASEAGGGVCINGNASLVLDGKSRVTGNMALRGSGGGLLAIGEASILVTGQSVVAGNVASESGGGVATLHSATLEVTGESVISSNTALRAIGGGVAGFNNTRVLLAGHSLITNNTGSGGGGGVVVVDNVSLLITDGTVFVGNVPLRGRGGAIWAGGNSIVDLSNGVVVKNSSIGRFNLGGDVLAEQRAQLHMDSTVLGQSGALTRCSESVFLRLDRCGAGEYKAYRACVCCPRHTYSFALNTTRSTCEPCPAFAVCPGADQVLPLPGYWRSGPNSVQVHRCPLGAAACAGSDKCVVGYQGHLCAQCTPGWGTTLPLKCGKCMEPLQQLGVYLAIACGSVMFVAGTVHFTWVDNVEGSSHVRVSDVLKVVVHYLQFLVLLGSLSAPWPPALVRLFGAATVVFGVAQGQALSLDCWLSVYVPTATPPLAIKRVLVAFLAPAVVFVACAGLIVLLWAARWVLWKVSRVGGCSSDGAMPVLVLFRKLPVLAIVVLFYAYPTLTKASLGLFACLHIDDASKEPFAEFALANHTSGYWVGDIQKECYVGWHKSWALGLGVPAVLLFCVCLPVGMGLFLFVNRSRCGDLSFREHFGFLYRNTEKRVWWEAVWAAQIVILTCISVFHFAIRTYYAILLFAFLFLIIAVLHMITQPCTEILLHRLQLGSMAALFCTSYCTLALFTVKGRRIGGAVPLAVSILLISINCVFLLCCMYIILRCTSATFRGWADSVIQTLATVRSTAVTSMGRLRRQPIAAGAAVSGAPAGVSGTGAQTHNMPAGCLPHKRVMANPAFWTRLSHALRLHR